MDGVFEIDKVTYRYFDRITALSDVSLSVGEGERCAIIGSNGSGKSTLLQIMSGLIYPSSGSVRFRGREVSEQSLKDRFLRIGAEAVWSTPEDMTARAEREKPMWQEAVRVSGARVE